MARTVLDSQLDSRTARARLQTRVKPYFRAIDPGLHLAYRRNTTGGTWSVRMYLGGGKYQMALLGTADDLGDADGVAALNFSHAQAAARARYTQATRAANGLPLGRKQPGDLRGCPCRSACRRPQARAPSWLSSMANVIHAPAIDRQHLGRDEAGIRLDQESHGGGNVLRRANPTDHGALAH
jgi:hypothetical protein